MRVALTALLIVSSSGVSLPARDQQTAVVAGRVIEGTSGAAAAGVAVTITSPLPGAPRTTTPPPGGNVRRLTAVTNADGRFVFRDLPAGQYAITTAPGRYLAGAYGRLRPNGQGRNLDVVAGARITDVAIRVWLPSVITGAIRDDRGEPVVGAGIWALKRVMANGRYETTVDGGTVEASDDRGQYRLAGLQPGSYVVCVRSTTQTVSLETSRAYQVAVTSGTTADMRRRWIETGGIFPQQSGITAGEWMVSTSSAEPMPLPGPQGTILVQPTVCAPGGGPAREPDIVTLAPGEVREGVDMVLPLVPGVRLSGVLMGPDGPAANSGVRYNQAAGTGELRQDYLLGYSITDSAGRFAFLGVTPGSYVVRAFRVTPTTPLNVPAPPPPGAPPGLRREQLPVASTPMPAMYAETAVTVGRSNVDGLVLTYEEGARIKGRIAFEGATQPPAAETLQRVVIGIRPLDAPVLGIPGEVRGEQDGTFTSPGYPPGRHIIAAVTPPAPGWVVSSIRIGGVDATGRAFTLAGRDIEDAVITFTDRPMTVQGTVRAADSSRSPEATVVLFPADTQEWMASGMSIWRWSSVPTAPDGSYQLTVPLPGKYVLVAVPPEIDPVIDRDFISRFGPSGVVLSFAPGDVRTQALTVGRAK